MASDEIYEQIMHQVRSGLSGKPEEDAAYLKKEAVKYRNHPVGSQIIKQIGRLLYDCLPDAVQTEWVEAIQEDAINFQARMNEVTQQLEKHDAPKALELLEPLTAPLENSNVYMPGRYMDFLEPFQEVLYDYYYQPSEQISPMPVPICDLEMRRGYALMELGEVKAAQAALHKGLEYNPFYFPLLCEYIETLKVSGDMNEYVRLTKEAFAAAYKKEYMARCYRNMGYYLIEQKQYADAAICYQISLTYEASPHAMGELAYISQIAGKQPGLTLETAEECSKKHGFPLMPDPVIMDLAYSYGKAAYDRGDTEVAIYFLSILNDLYPNEEITETLSSLQKPPTEEW